LKQTGFTVTELLIAVFIILLVTVMALPSIMSGMAVYRVNSAAHSIASQIQTARFRAIRNNSTQSFLVTSTRSGVDTNINGNLNDGQDMVYPFSSRVFTTTCSAVPVASATDIAPGASGTSGIAFTPRGTLKPLTNSGTPDFSTAFPSSGIVLCLSNGSNLFAAISVSPAGLVRTWRSKNGSSWSN
jgi:Tfp pilus assembly protein FimT